MRDTHLRGYVDAVAEGEEGVGGDRDALEAGDELGLVGRAELLGRRRHLLVPVLLLDGRHRALDVGHARVDPLLLLRPACPGQKPPFWAVKRPARPYKSATQN